MSDGRGPWEHHTPAGGGAWVRRLIRIALVVGGGAAVWALFRLFPGHRSDWDWGQLVWVLVVLTVVSGAVVSARQFKFGELARNIAIWGGIAAVLVLGYTFQDDLGGVLARVESEFLPGSAVESSPHVLTLTESDDGNFYVYGDVQSTRVRFLVDTGASDIVLSPSDAKRVGIEMASLHFIHGFETANGLGDGAPVRLSSLSIGPIRFTDVAASVNRAEMSSSLLGMAFLRRLDRFEIQGRRMLLHWH